MLNKILSEILSVQILDIKSVGRNKITWVKFPGGSRFIVSIRFFKQSEKKKHHRFSPREAYLLLSKHRLVCGCRMMLMAPGIHSA